MTTETSRTSLRITEREDTVRSFLKKPSVSIYATLYGNPSQKSKIKGDVLQLGNNMALTLGLAEILSSQPHRPGSRIKRRGKKRLEQSDLCASLPETARAKVAVGHKRIGVKIERRSG
jgi:hypothetical protein